MQPRFLAALLAPLLTSGCMLTGMAGVGGMGHVGHGQMAADEASIRMREVSEVVAEGLRISIDSPVRASSDSASVLVELHAMDGRVIAAPVALFLNVGRLGTTHAGDPPAKGHAGHETMAAPAVLSEAAFTRVTPVSRGDGRYEFRLALAPEQSYRLTVVVERVGDKVMSPPLRVGRMMAPASDASSAPHSAHGMWGGASVPLALLGAGLMAAMMLVSWR